MARTRNGYRCPVCGCLALEWLSVQTVARALGVSRRTIIRRIHDGSIEAIRVGAKLWRIRHATLDRYIQARNSLGVESER